MENSILGEIKSLNLLMIKKLNQNAYSEEIRNRKPPSPAQMQILDYIFKHESEEIYQKDLENIFNVSRATVSGVLQTMEKCNLIERVVDETDTRTKKIILNHKAKEIFHTYQKNMKQMEMLSLKEIDEKDLETFLKVLKKMKENISNSINN